MKQLSKIFLASALLLASCKAMTGCWALRASTGRNDNFGTARPSLSYAELIG